MANSTEQFLDNIPASLRNRQTWLLHRCTPPDPATGKVSREPHGADGYKTNTNPKKFLTFDAACAALPRFDGLTIALADGGVVCVDLDHCRNPETGELTPAAREIVETFGDTYIEISGSGTGLHIFCVATLPKNLHPDGSWVELYDHDKPIAMTGNLESWQRVEVTECQAAVDALFQRVAAGEFVPGAKWKKQVQEPTQKTSGDASADDWARVGQVARQSGAVTADALEAALRGADATHWQKRDQQKGKRDGKTYLRYTIDHFLAQQPAQAMPTIQVVDTDDSGDDDRGDMPRECLDGWLGTVCTERLADCPRGFAWPALLGTASVFVPHDSNQRANLFVTLDGPIHSGKSYTFTKVFHLFSLKKDTLPRLDAKCGSVEGLVELLAKKGVNNGASVIVYPGELGHLLEKAEIKNAAFHTVLCDALYDDFQDLTVTNRKQLTLNARLSLMGGVVSERFGELFGASATAGFYDRQLFGACPEDYPLDYMPFDEETPVFEPPDNTEGFRLNERPVPVKVDKSVFSEISRWKKQNGFGREAELALRAAVVAASFDGRTTLSVDMLAPAFALAKWQKHLRTFLKPNPGENPDAKMAIKIKDWLLENANDGRWTGRRLLGRMIHADRLGPGVFDRAITSMVRNGDLETGELLLPGQVRKTSTVRLVVRNLGTKTQCYLVTDRVQ